VFVYVAIVRYVAVTVVHEVDVISVRHRLVPAVVAMGVCAVVLRADVQLARALVPVAVVQVVEMTVVQEVDMSLVHDGGVAAVLAVLMLMLVVGVGVVGDSHDPLLSM
jgi:hypothetical protein